MCRCDLSVHVRRPPTSVDNQKAGHTQHTLGLLVFFITIIVIVTITITIMVIVTITNGISLSVLYQQI